MQVRGVDEKASGWASGSQEDPFADLLSRKEKSAADRQVENPMAGEWPSPTDDVEGKTGREGKRAAKGKGEKGRRKTGDGGLVKCRPEHPLINEKRRREEDGDRGEEGGKEKGVKKSQSKESYDACGLGWHRRKGFRGFK